VWSASPSGALDFPALPLLKFMHHHMFLTLDTVKWNTPKGRSETYVRKLVESCPKLNVRTSCSVKAIEAEERVLVLASGERIEYDSLILTCSAPIQAAMNPPSKTWCLPPPLSLYRTPPRSPLSFSLV
jgi:predicted NAD/FAD-binding protein